MKKIKLAILTLLGFSTACSTVKNSTDSNTQVPAEATQATSDEEVTPSEDEQIRIERIKLMYGVPSPRSTENTETPTEEPTK